MTTKELETMGYTVKHSDICWWVDGVCGYRVTGYYGSEQEAVNAAWTEIQIARAMGKHPIWLYGE